MPMGMEANLEWLAMRDGDYGAMVHGGIEKHPDDPSMCVVETWHRKDKLEKMGWEGFTAEQL